MQHNLDKSPEKISGMFDSIARHYDSLNHILSFGADILWRKKMVRKISGDGIHKVIDIACGTGDLTVELARRGYNVTGLDITRGMLEIARNKYLRKTGREPRLVLASACETPFENGSFDAATISFGIRNFDRRDKCLEEISRILRPEGKLAILEFAEPRNKAWNSIYSFYFKNILPRVGKLLSHNSEAYSYLHDSVVDFPKYEEFCNELQNSGFKDTICLPLMGGIAALYICRKA